MVKNISRVWKSHSGHFSHVIDHKIMQRRLLECQAYLCRDIIELSVPTNASKTAHLSGIWVPSNMNLFFHILQLAGITDIWHAL